MKRLKIVCLIVGLCLLLIGCRQEEEVVRLATTTSTEDSGLLKELLPIFEAETDYNVEVIAVGTGQALEIGRRRDADILLVHALELEKKFVKEGYGRERFSVMYNDFVIVGPKDDPADIAQKDSLADALVAIYELGLEDEVKFLSRGDDSGTYNKEVSLWAKYDLSREGRWYKSLGQGMGDTLVMANELRAYTLADRSTYLAMEDKLKGLEILFEDGEKLFNCYGLIAVNSKDGELNYTGANDLIEFFLRDDIQEKIAKFGQDEYGQPLFLIKK